MAFLTAAGGTPVCAATKSTLERAVLELPAEALADIPIKERRVFLAELRRDKPANKRLDIKNGFLEFYSDGDVPFHVTSVLYVKVFPRVDGGDLIFCHMPKPHADRQPPRMGQLYFFELRNDRWVDVTAQVLPEGVDTRWHFKPRRADLVIEAGPYQRIKRRGAPGYAYRADRRTLDLVWDGTRFLARKPKSSEFSYDSL